MPAQIGTIMFDCLGRGWSETYYAQYTSITAFIPEFVSLITLRLGLSPGLVKVKAVRVQDAAVRRSSRYIPVGSTFRQGTFDDGVTPPSGVNQLSDAVLVELFGDDVHKNKKFIRGLPDELITNGVFVPDTTWLNVFQGLSGFTTALISSSFRVRTWNPATSLFVYTAINAVTNRGLTSRKTGRPFGQQRGRRPIRRAPVTPVVPLSSISGLATPHRPDSTQANQSS